MNSMVVQNRTKFASKLGAALASDKLCRQKSSDLNVGVQTFNCDFSCLCFPLYISASRLMYAKLVCSGIIIAALERDCRYQKWKESESK